MTKVANSAGPCAPSTLLDRCGGIVLNLGLDAEKFLTPRLAQTLWALINGVPYTETVVARSAFVAAKFSTLRTRIKRPSFSVAVLLIQHVFTSNTHSVLQFGMKLYHK